MLNEPVLRQGISKIEQCHSLDKRVDDEELAEALGIDVGDESEELERFEDFCRDYDNIRDNREDQIELVNKQYSKHKFNFYRTARNGALSAILGSFSEPMLYSALAMAGAGMAVTAYDEATNKGTMNLQNVWFATAIGAFIGHFF